MINLDEQLKNVRTAAIAGHVRPDGDAFGSCMGMYLFLRTYYPQVDTHVYLEGNFSDAFRFVAHTDEIITSYPEIEPVDLFISLDVSALDRFGSALPYFNAAKRTLVIDHHISNPLFGAVNEVQPDSSSTSELVTLLIGKDRLTKEIAEPLYLGVINDSGVFRYSCTSSRTMEIAGWLMDTGIDFSKICDVAFYQKTYAQTHVIGKALSESMLMLDGKVIFSVIHQKEMNFYGVGPQDLSPISSILRETEGVEVAIFLYESGIREFKVSMRSNGKVDVAKIAQFFQGGGHVNAAGCTMNGGVHDVVNNIVAKVAEQLHLLSAGTEETAS